MLHLGQNRTRNKVNVLKKVKVDGKWKWCPAIVEAGGRLKDRVQVKGRAEVHDEGVYYIEWRENNRRLRGISAQPKSRPRTCPPQNHIACAWI